MPSGSRRPEAIYGAKHAHTCSFRRVSLFRENSRLPVLIHAVKIRAVLVQGSGAVRLDNRHVSTFSIEVKTDVAADKRAVLELGVRRARADEPTHPFDGAVDVHKFFAGYQQAPYDPRYWSSTYRGSLLHRPNWTMDYPHRSVPDN